MTQNVPSNLITNSNFASNLSGWQGGLALNSIAGLESWYNAGSINGVSNGSNVSAWSDSSGNGHNLSQATSNNQPIMETSDINGLPAVRFNGTSDYMAGTASGFTNASTVLSMQTVRSSVTGGTYEFGINGGVNTGISNLPWGGTMYARSSDRSWRHNLGLYDSYYQHPYSGIQWKYKGWSGLVGRYIKGDYNY